MRTFILVLIAIMALLLPGLALAEDHEQAREHFRRGTTYFELKRFKEAADEYEKAYRVAEDPALLFNIAQAHRGAGDYDAAINWFQAYLRRLPKAPNRRDVMALVDNLKKVRAEQQRAERRPPSGTMDPDPAARAARRPVEPEAPVVAVAVTPDTSRAQVEVKTPEPAQVKEPARANAAPALAPKAAMPAPASDRMAQKGRTLKIAGVATGAAGLAAVGAGIAMAVLAKDASDQITNAAPGTTFDPSLAQNGRTFEAAGIGLLAGGGAAVVAGTVLYVLGLKQSGNPRLAITPSVGARHAALTATIRF
jgi:tetratricopeptide (TPR) repeat protein